jgi:hypothetical protein
MNCRFLYKKIKVDKWNLNEPKANLVGTYPEGEIENLTCA